MTDGEGSDRADDRPGPSGEDGDEAPTEGTEAASSGEPTDGETSVQALREAVEREYDFEEFGPADMAEMTGAEWEAAFDPDAWVTDEELLDRVEAELRARVADRDVFAVVERTRGEDPKVVAYSESSYAVVHPDGSVEGEGPVLRDVKPSVALASMPEYEVPDAPAGGSLPDPTAVRASSSRLGNVMLQVIAGVLGVAALVLFGATLFADLGGATVVAVFVGVGFVVVAAVLLLTVANSRLSARYRAEEYRKRLRGAGVGTGERPDFLPVEDSEFED